MTLVWSERNSDGAVTQHQRQLNQYEFGALLADANIDERAAESFNTLFASFSMTKEEEALMRATITVSDELGNRHYRVYAGDGAPVHAFDVNIVCNRSSNEVNDESEGQFSLALDIASVAVAFNGMFADIVKNIVKSRIAAAPPGCTHWGPWRGYEYEISLHRVIENNCAVCADDLDVNGHCRECCVTNHVDN